MEDKENTFKLVESRDALDLVPTWEMQAWWFVAGAVVILLVGLLVVFTKRAKTSQDPLKAKREAYISAKAELEAMGDGGSRDSATVVSLTLRNYLARSMNEPALFETHEEFIGRHEGLKDLPEDIRSETGNFFGELAALKYAPENILVERSIRDQGIAMLERIHQA